MRIVLTSDTELWSWNRNFEQDIEKGASKLIELSEKERIPITLFISLSDKGYWYKDYLKKILDFVNKIDSRYVNFGVHSHCKNLPLNFPTLSDDLRDYNEEEMVKILKWYKDKVERITGKKIKAHRAGSYSIPNLRVLENVFNKVGLKIDSSLIHRYYSKPIKLHNLIEIPPATNKKYSNKLRVWSPEQMSMKELVKFYQEAKKFTDVLVINFHSFSVYGSLKAKGLWYKTPGAMRALLRPIIKIFKEKKSFVSNVEKTKISENFHNLFKIIKFLKKENCEFIALEKIV